MSKYAVLALTCSLALGCNESTQPKRADVTVQKPVVEESKAVDADNTAVNVRDRDQATKTPLDQNENKKDIEITASIRKKVIDTKLSTAAHNVKIITRDGKVTLRGPVDSAEEKQRIAEIARSIVDPGSVDDQLEVKADK